ncbi:hypothetical protein ABZS29_16685 [Kribbella sp. NPDC005582]|uniref:hypothetical protein n=1 Tax=Kribbella sp. NPDC005582 TaxID=3156893 RepID=UPI0033BE87FF
MVPATWGQVTRGCEMHCTQRLLRRFVVLSAASLLGVGLLPGAADAVTTSSAARCGLNLGSVTQGGDHRSQRITVGSPPTRTNIHFVVPKLYDEPVRLSTSMFLSLSGGDPLIGGHVIIGPTLARTTYAFMNDGTLDTASIRLTPIAGGHEDTVVFEESRYREGITPRTTSYAVGSDGILVRQNNVFGNQWETTGTAAGFGLVKTMALISKTRTYDTFLATTRGGVLTTVHIPTTSPMKPVVKRVRASTWQRFEFLIAQKCGTQGTLLLGVDKDTQSAYLYAVGHANGTSTVIQALGRVPGAFADPTYFRFTPLVDSLVGE